MKQSDKTYITFGQAAKLLPNRPHCGTVWRWATRGIKAPDGSVVKLQSVRYGRSMYTTVEWLADFGHASAAAFAAAKPGDPPSLPTKAEARRFIASL